MHKIALLICSLASFSAAGQASFRPEELVNTLIGSDSKRNFSSGNTYPAIMSPL